MATQANLDQAQQLYVAYYGRPADAAGLEFWATKIEEDGIAAVISDFGASAEFEARFGELSNEERVENLYQQMFGRAADEEGLEFYTERLDDGRLNLTQIAAEIAGGAQNEDVTILENKLAAANLYTDAAGEQHSGTNADNYAAEWLATIDADTDLESLEIDEVVAGIPEPSVPAAALTEALTALSEAEAAITSFLEDSAENNEGFAEYLDANAVDTDDQVAVGDAVEDYYEATASAVGTNQYVDIADFEDRSSTIQNTAIEEGLSAAEEAVADFEAEIAEVEGLAQAVRDYRNAVTADAAAADAQAEADEDTLAAEAAFEARTANPAISIVENGDGVFTAVTDGGAGDAAVEFLTVNADGQVVIEEAAEGFEGIESLRDTLQAQYDADVAAVEADAALTEATTDLNTLYTDAGTVLTAADGSDLTTGVDVAEELGSYEADLTELQTAVEEFQNARELNNDLTSLEETRTEAYDNLTESEEEGGLGINLITAADDLTATDNSDVYLFSEELNGETIDSFGEVGQDRLYFGSDFELVALGDNEITDRVGSADQLEVFWEQNGDNLMLYVENDAEAGRDTALTDISTITLTGVSSDDINFNDGFLTAGTVEVA